MKTLKTLFTRIIRGQKPICCREKSDLVNRRKLIPAFAFILILSGLLLPCLSLKAQEPVFIPDRFWFEANLGAYHSVEETGGISWGLGVCMNQDSRLYKVRFLYHDEFALFGPEPSERFGEMGFMLGKVKAGKYFQLQASAGLGVISGYTRGDLLYTEQTEGWVFIGDPNHYEEDRFFTPAIPLEVDLIFKPLSVMGAGVSLYANLNLERPLYGFTFKCGLGKMR